MKKNYVRKTAITLNEVIPGVIIFYHLIIIFVHIYSNE